MSQSLRFLLSREKAESLVTSMEKCVKTKWYRVARDAGVTEKDCELISNAFAYPGFRTHL